MYGYWETFRNVLCRKTLLFFVAFTSVLCFGFTITHFSIGVDDPAAYHYLQTDHYGSMIQQGRLLHVLYSTLTGSLEFLPFLNDFLGACLLACSALLFCSLFQHIAKGTLSTATMTAFCCIYISTPILSDKFIYQLDVVVTMFSYCACALALLYTLHIDAAKSNFVKAVAMLMLSIASYESFGFLYFCGVFAIFIFRIIVNREALGCKELFKEGMKYAAVLIAAFLLYYGLVFLVQLATGQYGLFSRSTPNLPEQFWSISKSLAKTVFLSGSFSVSEFTLVSVIGSVLFLLLSIRRRNPWILLCYIALFSGNFFIHYACGFFLHRAAQTFCLFIAFVLMMLMVTVSKSRRLKQLSIAAAVLFVLVQSAEMNRWFYNDYIRYQKEAFATNAIATRLLGECNVSKPVVFVESAGNEGFLPYLNTHYYSYDPYAGKSGNGNSVLYWAEDAFGESGSPLMLQLFRMHGYDFLVKPNAEQVSQGRALAENMPAWPNAGCILETEEYIVVKIR